MKIMIIIFLFMGMTNYSFSQVNSDAKKMSFSVLYSFSGVLTEKKGYNSKETTYFSGQNYLGIIFHSSREKNRFFGGIAFQQQHYESKNPIVQSFIFNGNTYEYTLNKKRKYYFLVGDIGYSIKISKKNSSYISPHIFLGKPVFSHIYYDYSPDHNITPYVDQNILVEDMFMGGVGINFTYRIKTFGKLAFNGLVTSSYRYIDHEDEINIGAGIEINLIR